MSDLLSFCIFQFLSEVISFVNSSKHIVAWHKHNIQTDYWCCIKGSFKIGLATISFNIFMVLGRLTGDWFRDRLGVYKLILILFTLTLISLLILTFFDSIILSILGFALLGMGTSSIIPIAYSLAGKIKGIESGVGISIISIAVYGTFMGAPASLGLLANNYGVNSIFFPMLLIFLILLLPIGIFKNEFKL